MVELVSYSGRLKGERAEMVYLVRARSNGRKAWFLAEIDKLKRPLLAAAAKSGQFDLTRYGRVLYSGWGEGPGDEILENLKSQYN